MEVAERIAAVKANPAYEAISDKHKSFIDSLENWVKHRSASSAQVAWLERVEKMLVAPIDPNWFDFSNEENKKKREYAIKHYQSAGYWPTVVARMVADPTYMPDKEVWEKMWNNKYIGAAYKRWSAGARFKVGDMVVNKYYPHYYGTIAVIEEIAWYQGTGTWNYVALPLAPNEQYNPHSGKINADESKFLPASKRNLKARNLA